MAQSRPPSDYVDAMQNDIHDLIQQGQPAQSLAAFILRRWQYLLDEILFSIIYWGGIYGGGQYVLDLLHMLDFGNRTGAEANFALDQACDGLMEDDPETATRLCEILRTWLASSRARARTLAAAIERAAAEARGMVAMQVDRQAAEEVAQARWRALQSVTQEGIDAPRAAEPGLRRMSRGL